MSKSVAAKTPKSGELQHQQQLNSSSSKVTVVTGGSSSTTKTPPVRLTRSISSKPGFEASRRAPKPHKDLTKAKVKSNPSLLRNQDGIQSLLATSRSSAKKDQQHDHGSGVPVLQARRFAKRGESSLRLFNSVVINLRVFSKCKLSNSIAILSKPYCHCVGGLSFGFLHCRLLHDETFNIDFYFWKIFCP